MQNWELVNYKAEISEAAHRTLQEIETFKNSELKPFDFITLFQLRGELNAFYNIFVIESEVYDHNLRILDRMIEESFRLKVRSVDNHSVKGEAV